MLVLLLYLMAQCTVVDNLTLKHLTFQGVCTSVYEDCYFVTWRRLVWWFGT